MAAMMRKTGQSQYATLDQQDLNYNPDLPQETQNEVQHAWKPQPRMSGGKRAIYFALACIIIPMLGLSGLIIGLVFGYQVERNESFDTPLALAQQSDTDKSAYYVNINSTTFATIASWSSTVAPLLVIAAMSLASFPVARKLKDKSSTDTSDLPTPFQLSLLLETLTGSIMSLWTLMRYRRWQHKQPIPSLVRSAFVILVVASIVGYAVAGIDTWLHLVMDTVEVDLVSLQDAVLHTYGRGLADPLCSNQTAEDFEIQSCTVSLATTGSFLVGANTAYKTLANLSTVHAVRRADAGTRRIAYLGPAEIPAKLDYQANTLAMHTECVPIAAKCNLHVEDGASEPFHCSDAFFGDLPSRYVNGSPKDPVSELPNGNTGVTFYEDTELTKYANDTFANHVQNPYYVGVWAYPFGVTAQEDTTDDGNIVTPMHGGISWLLSCTATAYELTYSWVNGSARVDELTKANGTVGTIINSPIYYGFGRATMESNALAASAEENAQALADSYAYLYSRMVMALVSGSISGRTNILEQRREPTLVARVPKVPLYMLVAFNLIYAVLGLSLAFVAMTASPAETNDVRERLSIAGIVALSFEGPRARRPVEKKREMFAEHAGEGPSRIGIERSGFEGWEYTLRQDPPKHVE